MFARIIRPRTIERRLLLWLLIITLVPSLSVLAVASWAGHWATRWVGASGSWSGVAESGRDLIQKAESDAPDSAKLQAAAETHRQQLTSSLTQARRLEFVGERLRGLQPVFFFGLAILVALIAIWAARRMARTVSRPIRELVDWSGRLAREEPLPGVTSRELREVKEIQALRAALRHAADEIAIGRARALESERTKSWGEMARRVAHEMKNPLTPLRLASHRLNEIVRAHPELAEPIVVISEETQRLEELAANFAMLGRPAEGARAAIDVHDMLQRLLATDVPATIQASLLSSSSEPFVLADYNALLQAFRNVVRNAVEAVSASSEDARIDVQIADEANDLMITIKDSGAGLAEKIVSRVFEPDFTSKPGGTGLGLAVARQTIRAHGGDVRAANAGDGGAEFIVRLPRTTITDDVA